MLKLSSRVEALMENALGLVLLVTEIFEETMFVYKVLISILLGSHLVQVHLAILLIRRRRPFTITVATARR